MFAPFFIQAAVSPDRQRAFRSTVLAHLLLVGGAASFMPPSGLGLVLLTTGIIEGALLIGWRLTQLPKTQALEFLLVSPLRPHRVFLAEACVGLTRLGQVTFAGLPVLLLLLVDGRLQTWDIVVLLVMPWTWGAVTGLGLTVWSFEPLRVRFWGERLMMLLTVIYLLVGVLAGEHLREWIDWLPEDLAQLTLDGCTAGTRYNPFAVMDHLLRQDPAVALPRGVAVEGAALALLAVLLGRGSSRLQGHFQERHYRPITDSGRPRGQVGDSPLSWWAVRRVTEYSGRVNLWLAGGFGLLYAAYTVAGPSWPAWLGREVFAIFERMGGIATLATALVVLAAVPAAFQYGLWDSNAQDRCKRLELLLLTQLTSRDYWEAAAAAAWRRGRGYFGVAVLLWVAAVVGGRMQPMQAMAALASGVILWGLYFAVGFRAFSRGLQANTLGLLLTLGLPLLTYVLYHAGWPMLAAMTPPGSVYGPGTPESAQSWLPGPLLGCVAAVSVARFSLSRCEAELRGWYDRHQGRKVLE